MKALVAKITVQYVDENNVIHKHVYSEENLPQAKNKIEELIKQE